MAFATAPDGRLLLDNGSNDRTARPSVADRPACLLVVQRRSVVNAIVALRSLIAIGDDEGTSVIAPALPSHRAQFYSGTFAGDTFPRRLADEAGG